MSDIWTSDLLLEILRKAAESYSVNLVIFAEASPELKRSLKQFATVTIEIQKKGFLKKLFATTFQVLRLIGKMKPQVIFASGLIATYSCIIPALVTKGSKFIYTRHHSDAHWSANRIFWRLLDRIAHLSFTKIVAVSNVVRSCLIHEGCPESKITTIWNGIDLTTFSKIRGLREPRGHSGLIRIGIVSRLEKWKGVQHTIKAVINLLESNPEKNVNFEISLTGANYFPVEHELQTLLIQADEMGIIRRLEWQSDMKDFYQHIDVLIHVPESERVEAFGMVYIEALASGTPIIATVSGVLTDIPQLQNYIFAVRYQDSLDIEKALKTFANSKSSNTIGLPCPLELLQTFDIDRVAEKYCVFFSSV